MSSEEMNKEREPGRLAGVEKKQERPVSGSLKMGSGHHMWEACFLIKVKVQMRLVGPGSQRARWRPGNQDTASVDSHIEAEQLVVFTA